MITSSSSSSSNASSATYPPPSSAASSSSSSSTRARLAGVPTQAKGRPLTFPLGTVLGFLLGVSAASLYGYSHLLSAHRELSAQSREAIHDLRRTTVDVHDRILAQVLSSAVSREELRDVTEQLEKRIRAGDALWENLDREGERMLRRIVGLEEENLEMRRRLWSLGKYASQDQSSSPTTQLQSQPQPQSLLPQQEEEQRQRQRPYGSILWSGRSREGERLV